MGKSYLLETSQGFFFRMWIPQKLQPLFKKKELKKSIKTTNRKVAERQAIVYSARAFELFDALTEKTIMNFPFIDGFQLRDFIKKPDGYVSFTSLTVDPNKADEETKMLKVLFGEGAQNIVTEVIQTTPTQPTQAAIPQQSEIRYSEAVDWYIDFLKKRAEKRENGTSFDERAKRDPFKMFGEFLGSDLPVSQITEQNANDFYKELKKYPDRNSLSTEEANQDFKTLIKKQNVAKINSNTHGQRIGAISGLFKALQNKMGLSITNHFYGMADKKVMHKEAPINKRQSFTRPDLTQLFNLPIWSETKYEAYWEYWLPILAIHSGCRFNELLQLEKKDFVTEDDRLCISINDLPTTDEPDEIWSITPKRTKTANSIRKIPVHPDLFKYGLQEFIDSIGYGRIFPDIIPVNKKLTTTPGKRFNNEILIDAGIKIPKRKTFYSFRHTFMNELKKKKVTLEDRSELAGHSPRNPVTGLYGDEVDIDEKYRLICYLDFSAEMKDVIPWEQVSMIDARIDKIKETGKQVRRKNKINRST